MKNVVKWFLTLLRVVLGWYFLYEGISKITRVDIKKLPDGLDLDII
jgi:uncharacterized membrane protein YphA (DoxX/SURF4 family)